MTDAKQATIGLGTLSWRGHRSLDQTLKSYANEDFFNLFDDALVFLPDPDQRVRDVAAQFDIRVETSPQNLGIMAGMEEIARRLHTKYVFFTENDCPLVETKTEAKRQIIKAVDLLENQNACMARMRHIIQYGEAFETIAKYKRFYPIPDTLLAKIRRTFRPNKAKRLCGTAIYGETDPHLKFPKYIQNAGDGFYLVDTAVMPWTNQSIIVNRLFFLETIIPYCNSVPFGRNANGFRTIEIELNRSKFWTKSGWKIACGPGLLTHRRADDRGY